MPRFGESQARPESTTQMKKVTFSDEVEIIISNEVTLKA
jgi:hypothetical protein